MRMAEMPNLDVNIAQGALFISGRSGFEDILNYDELRAKNRYTAPTALDRNQTSNFL